MKHFMKIMLKPSARLKPWVILSRNVSVPKIITTYHLHSPAPPLLKKKNSIMWP